MGRSLEYWEEPMPRVWAATAESLLYSNLNKFSRELYDIKPSNLWVLDAKSPKQAREGLEDVAWRFKRDQAYDFVQYTADETTSRRDLPFCWIINDGGWGRTRIMVGGGCFRWRKWKQKQLDGESTVEAYGLSWVWIHSQFRRHGFMSKAWPFFLRIAPGFYPEPPYSKDMHAFLRKVQYHPYDIPA